MSEPITEERLERALIEFRRCNQSIEERAKRLLKRFTLEGIN